MKSKAIVQKLKHLITAWTISRESESVNGYDDEEITSGIMQALGHEYVAFELIPDKTFKEARKGFSLL